MQWKNDPAFQRGPKAKGLPAMRLQQPMSVPVPKQPDTTHPKYVLPSTNKHGPMQYQGKGGKGNPGPGGE
eukprot:4873512-Karenia_brevis.AAC.1